MKKLLYIIAGIIALVVIIVIVSRGEEKKEIKPEQQLQKPSQEQSTRKEVDYKIIEEEDISYLGCKRTGIRIVVPDEALKVDVSYTLGKIIDNYKSDWDDITVWAYKYSEEQQIGKIPYTMGMKEYSTCE